MPPDCIDTFPEALRPLKPSDLFAVDARVILVMRSQAPNKRTYFLHYDFRLLK